MKIVGVDPGASGALALIDVDGSSAVLLAVEDMPVGEIKIGKTLKRRVSPGMVSAVLEEWKAEHGIDRAYIEQVNAMPRQGVSSTFAFGMAFGIALGALAGNQVETHLVTPAQWKNQLRLTPGKDDPRMVAATRFPDDAKRFIRKKDDGRAEACLIALAGWRIAGGII